MRNRRFRIVPWACLAMLILGLVGGCPPDDQRVIEVSREAANRQAEQNRRMSEVARASSETQKALVQLQRDQQAERAQIDQQRDRLDAERRDIAGQRRFESVLGPTIEVLGGMLVIALALGFCWFLLFGLCRQGQDEPLAVHQLLLDELVLPGPDALPGPEKQLVAPVEVPPTAIAQRPE
jgi:hypothetical protein